MSEREKAEKLIREIPESEMKEVVDVLTRINNSNKASENESFDTVAKEILDEMIEANKEYWMELK